MSINFNEKSADSSIPLENQNSGEDPLVRSIRTGERTRFIHKPNPLVERAYQIFEYMPDKEDYEPVGDYVLLNKDESPELTDKKVFNFITLLNKKKELIDISNLTTTRLLFTVIPEEQSKDQTKIILKDYDGSGVSKNNAVITIRKGVFYDDRKF
ncbi:MAG: hypothetical protein ACRBDI_04715 [Alphaproteobacteria bacterium]